MRDDHAGTGLIAKAIEWEEEQEQEENLEPEETDLLKSLVNDSSRVNILVLGLEGARSDTMMFFSFNPVSKKVDGISIPRDTYYHREGYDRLDARKINAAYGSHGANGAKAVVSDLLLDIPVDYYVTVTYKGVVSIIDSLGGVPINIPQPMKYTDYADDPPLIIDFEKGHHLLDGEDAVRFLRFRKGYVDGDLGRIRAQQDFVKAAIKKALGFRLPAVATTALRYVRTDMGLQDVTRYATSAIGLNLADVNMTVLPGQDKYRNGASFYFQDIQATKDLLIEIYSEGKSLEALIVGEEEKNQNND